MGEIDAGCNPNVDLVSGCLKDESYSVKESAFCVLENILSWGRIDMVI